MSGVHRNLFLLPYLLLAVGLLLPASPSQAQVRVKGESLDPSAFGQSRIESMEMALERNKEMSGSVRPSMKDLMGHRGIWQVPDRQASFHPHSGEHYATNKWGDTHMAIRFPGKVNVAGAYFAGQGDRSVWTSGVRVIGFLQGQRVGESDWFLTVGSEPAWMEMNLAGVDRIEIEAAPVLLGG